MGCGSSSQAAGVSSPARGNLAPGQLVIIRNCPNARLNGERVTCQEYNSDLGEWLVKGDRFPLTVGMSLGAQFLEAVASPDTREVSVSSASPTLLAANQNGSKACGLLRTELEKYNAMFDGSKDHVGEFVSNVYIHAFGIIQEGSGLGESGECPFASAYEVHLFYRFCLNVCIAWSEHTIGEDEQIDNEFRSQMGDLCEILCFLDTDAVPLPEEIEQNIKLVLRDALFPYWAEAQMPKGESALRCCTAVGEKWGLEDTNAFQKALAALENMEK